MPTIDQTIQKLHSFATLSKGWHYGEGGPANIEDIQKAHDFLLSASDVGLEKANVFPGVDGQIEITFYGNGRTYAFLFDEEGISFTEESRCSILSDEYGLNYLEAEQKLWNISQKSQTLFDSYTYNIGTQSTAGSDLQLLAVLLEKSIQTAASRSSVDDAYWNPNDVCVNTSGISIQLS